MKEEKGQIKIGVALNYVNLILGNLIPIFYTPIMLSLLGQNEYGLYKLSSSVTSYLSLISLGLGSAVSRYLIKAQTKDGKEAEEKVLGLFVMIFRIIAVAALIVGTVLVMNLHLWYANSMTADELMRMKTIVFILVCNMSISFAVSPYQSVVSSHEKFLFVQATNIFSTCLGPILNLIVLFFGGRSIEMAASTMVTCVLINFLYLCYVHRTLHIRPKYQKMPVGLIKEIMRFSFWVYVANIVSQLYGATDTILIGAYAALGTAGVAVYNIGATFNSILQSMTFGLSGMLTPRTNKMVFSGATMDEMTDYAATVGRLQEYIALLITSGFIAFGQPFIAFYVGKGYEEAYWVAVVTMIPSLIPLAQSVCLNIIVAQNKHMFRSLVYLFIAVLNVAGTWVLIRSNGIVGAAFMTGAALIIGQGVVMNWYYAKKIHLDIPRFWKKVLPLFVLPACMCVATLILGRWINFYNFTTMLLGIVVYTVIYCILNWIFIMNPYEKSLVIVPMKRLLKKN